MQVPNKKTVLVIKSIFWIVSNSRDEKNGHLNYPMFYVRKEVTAPDTGWMLTRGYKYKHTLTHSGSSPVDESYF